MPIVLPHPIKSDSMGVYGNMIGIRKMQYRLPMFQTIDIYPTDMGIYEQVLIADSKFISETPNKAETALKADSDMLSESPNKAETVIITNP